MTRRRATPPQNPPVPCPACGRHDRTRHLTLYRWACLRCRREFTGDRTFRDGDPYLTMQEWMRHLANPREEAPCRT